MKPEKSFITLHVALAVLAFILTACMQPGVSRDAPPGQPAGGVDATATLPPFPEIIDGDGSAAMPDRAPRRTATHTPPPTETAVPLVSPTPAPTGTPLPPGVAPTPDAARAIPRSGVITSTHTVRRGDTLGAIALAYDMSLAELRRMNRRRNDFVRIGETLFVAIPVRGSGPSVKLIPDSELVNGPGALGFDLAAEVARHGGYLNRYSEAVGGETLSGVEIINRVSEQTSVHPRLLLAALEHASGWVTNAAPGGDEVNYPLGNRKTNFTGLYAQLTWAAARLNEGYYGWRLDKRYVVKFEDNDYAFLGNGINAGTAGVHNWLAAINPRSLWLEAAQSSDSPNAFISNYRRLFGDPWRFDRGMPVPPGVQQPEFGLPWAKGELWYLTGGPHSAWGRGTPWGAIDFTTGQVLGCRRISDYVRSMSDGTVSRSGRGEVVVALDPSGDDRIGWSVLYLHIGSEDRVPLGARLRRGDPIGHPSCEGGISTGAHVHIVRRYNGEWINATGAIPFVMGGWSVEESGLEYDGYLVRGNTRREACECKKPAVNGITW